MGDREPIFHGRHQMAPRVGTGAFPRAARGAASGGGGSGSATGGNTGATAAAGSTSVRRNLFRSQLTRRPTQATAAGSTASSAGSTDSLDDAGIGRGLSDSSARGPVEIVVRDRNGDVELVDPPSPTADELIDMARDTRQESERERQRLADAIKYHQQRTSIPGHPEEFLDALRASLRAKVSALAEDNWMYEPEDVPRLD